MMKTKKKCRGILIIGILLLVVGWLIWGNVTVKTTVYDIHDGNLPENFEGYRIVQISDLHNAEFGKGNSTLLKILERENPDLIALTGDLVDSEHTNIEVAAAFAEQAVKIAPCYYVTGNHEAWLREGYMELEDRLRASGVTVLRNQSVAISKDGEEIRLLGIDDPDFAEGGSGMFDMSEGIAETEIQQTEAGGGYKVLLSHRPEIFDTYVAQNVNLAFCGHAHGGQFRLPFIGGLVAPNQGFFPEYDSGVYQKGDTTMIVSRGIGNSIIPVRVNNRPEVVVAVLHTN